MSAFLSLTEQQKKALFAALSGKDVFAILSTGHGKCIIFQSVSIKDGRRTADYGLRTGYKIRTRYKRRTTKYGLGIKHGQGIKRGLWTADWV